MMNVDFKKISIAQPHARLTLKVLHRSELLENHLLASTLPCSLEALLEALLLEAQLLEALLVQVRIQVRIQVQQV